MPDSQFPSVSSTGLDHHLLAKSNYEAISILQATSMVPTHTNKSMKLPPFSTILHFAEQYQQSSPFTSVPADGPQDALKTPYNNSPSRSEEEERRNNSAASPGSDSDTGMSASSNEVMAEGCMGTFWSNTDTPSSLESSPTYIDGGQLDQVPLPLGLHFKGWYDPSSRYSQAICEHVSGWDRTRLYESYFAHRPGRPLYGQQGLVRTLTDNILVASQPDPIDPRAMKQHGQKVEHARVERKRRDRHHFLQLECSRRTADVVGMLCDIHMSEFTNKSGATHRKPGKDEQLLSNVIMMELGALVLQSEHEGRVSAEYRCADLIRQLEIANARISTLESHVEHLMAKPRRDYSGMTQTSSFASYHNFQMQ